MVKMNTEELTKALHNKYDDEANSYAFLEQVGNSTGFACKRHADAIAVSLWQSRGLTITGFEIKASRQDWIHELKHPEKADEILQHCHYWYLVVGEKDIVQFGELPTNWGLMIPHTKNTVKVVKEATLNPNVKPIDMPIFCAILRRVQREITDIAKYKARYDEGYKDGQKLAKENAESSMKYTEQSYEELKNRVKTFEKISGIELDNWRHKPEDVANAVNMVLNGAYKRELDNLESLHKHAINVVKGIEEGIQKHKEDINKKAIEEEQREPW
jgi:hypothetical protein